MSIDSVDIEILGREFTIACKEEERQDVLDAASYLEKKMREIRDTGKVVGLERVAIMAALNLSHEVLNTKTGDIDTGDYKRRINVMLDQIDAVIANQDKLL